MQYAHHIGACRDSLLSCGFNFVAVIAFIFFTGHQGSCQHSTYHLCLWSGKFRSVWFADHQGGFLWNHKFRFESFNRPTCDWLQKGQSCRESHDSSVWLLQHALTTHGFTAHWLATHWLATHVGLYPLTTDVLWLCDYRTYGYNYGSVNKVCLPPLSLSSSQTTTLLKIPGEYCLAYLSGRVWMILDSSL